MRSGRICVGARSGARKTSVRGVAREVGNLASFLHAVAAGREVGSRSAGETRMKRVLLAACVLAVVTGEAFAQPYPSRPVTMIVPFGAGGPTDAVAGVVGGGRRGARGGGGLGAGAHGGGVGAGGPPDALARIVAERMRGALGQAVLVENVTGEAFAQPYPSRPVTMIVPF